jgi:hypothetical protein
MIADPKTDDRIIYPANERNNKCYNYGRQGHWAKDCKKPVRKFIYNPEQNPFGEAVILKETLYKNTKLGDRIRNLKRKISNHNFKRSGKLGPAQGRSNTRVHFANPAADADAAAESEDEFQPDPIARFGSYDDLEKDLQAVLNDLEGFLED